MCTWVVVVQSALGSKNYCQEVRSATGNKAAAVEQIFLWGFAKGALRRVSVQCELRPQRACLIVSTGDGYAVLRVVRGKDEHATRYVQQALVR